MRLIGIAAPARSGKDTVADILAEKDYLKYSFAGPLKEGIISMFGLTSEHVDGGLKEEVLPWLGVSPRYLMQTLGTDWARDIVNPDTWLILAEMKWKSLVENRGRCAVSGMVVSDVRFDNEADWIRKNGGEIWHIVRPELNKVLDHASESGIVVSTEDKLLFNDGTIQELGMQVNVMLEE